MKTRQIMTVLLVLMTLLVAACQAQPTPEVVVQNLDEIKAQIDAGNYAEAMGALETYIAEQPEDAEAQFLLGLAYFNLGNYEEAREAFNESLNLDSDRAGAVHHNLGVLEYQAGNLEKAIEEFNTALETDPEDPDTHYQLGAAYLVKALPANSNVPDEEWLRKAQSQFQKALDLQPGKAEALVGLGNSYLLENRIDEAIEVLEQAVEENPQMPEALFALGRTYATAGQTEQARETLQAFLETNPPQVWAEQARQLLVQLGE